MESRVYFKNIHVTPKKLRYLLPEIKKMKPQESLDYLLYSPKKPAQILYKVIKSAIDNAKYTLKIDGNLLKFKLLTVEQGNVLKRYRPGGRGTAKPYKKRLSHIKIILQANVPVKKTVEVKKELPIVSPVQNASKGTKKTSVKRSARKKDGTKS